jgi:hypothetical protein
VKLHYFTQNEADKDDVMLGMAKMQDYVPATCLLGGIVVMDEVGKGRNPCWGCNGPREKCLGNPKTGGES